MVLDDRGRSPARTIDRARGRSNHGHDRSCASGRRTEMWCEFERCYADLEHSVTEAHLVENVVSMAGRDSRGVNNMQLLQWVVEGHGVERLSLSADDSTALATRVISRAIAEVKAERSRLAVVASSVGL
jgi:hypothetical protein